MNFCFRKLFRFGAYGASCLCVFAFGALSACPQQAPPDWETQVRKDAAVADWSDALRLVNGVLSTYPADYDARAWHARLLFWSGNAKSAEAEFLSLAAESPKDPDIWQGLASVYERESLWDDALKAIDRAEALDSRRVDLHVERARILKALNRTPQAHEEFRQVLAIDPDNVEAKAALTSPGPPPKQELRIGTDNDLLSYGGAYHGEWLSLTSSWSQHWTTSIAGDFYQRGGPDAGKFVGSITAKSARFGAFTAGGAIGHDSAIIPRSEAFFDLDRGWRLSEDRPLRGAEATYEQHWYWYSTARIFTLSGGTLVYLPRDWTWSIDVTGVRNSFPGLPVGWKPSGMSRLNFPLLHWKDRALGGNVLFAVGSEDFALIDQLGSFASQTYGGGFRFQLSATQDVTGYASFQQRTQDRADTTFGFSYGIRF
ncbi:MAG TPA: tetratricopeptide repeat protein [Candidatus Acidoferrales bacterium]|nr:tetratricopeptide repeat protein [Candidatus Acidoferrales bacterium]